MKFLARRLDPLHVRHHLIGSINQIYRTSSRAPLYKVMFIHLTITEYYISPRLNTECNSLFCIGQKLGEIAILARGNHGVRIDNVFMILEGGPQTA